jgi:hypothetical protein
MVTRGALGPVALIKHYLRLATARYAGCFWLAHFRHELRELGIAAPSILAAFFAASSSNERDKAAVKPFEGISPAILGFLFWCRQTFRRSSRLLGDLT